MTSLPFIKMHGCGNDYIFIDGMNWSSAQTNAFDFTAVARRVSDRHRSIGGDGLVAMLASDRSDADARMRMFNADGSEGNLCGNALRCMAMWLHQSGHCGTRCRIEMHDRVIGAEIIHSDSIRKCAIVRVDIGRPVVLAPAASGLQKYVRHTILNDIQLHGQPLRIVEVSMGNPHAMIIVEDLAEVPFEVIGPQVERHPAFPKRTNVEFVQITGSNRARVRVWERGSGETQACGSGACATGVMGWATDQFLLSQPVEIQMRGGNLLVHMSAEECVSLEGAAEESARGHLILNQAQRHHHILDETFSADYPPD